MRLDKQRWEALNGSQTYARLPFWRISAVTLTHTSRGMYENMYARFSPAEASGLDGKRLALLQESPFGFAFCCIGVEI